MSWHVNSGQTGSLPDTMTGHERWEDAASEVMLRFDDLGYRAFTELDLAIDNAEEETALHYEFSPFDDAGADYVSIVPCEDDDCEVCTGEEEV